MTALYFGSGSSDIFNPKKRLKKWHFLYVTTHPSSWIVAKSSQSSPDALRFCEKIVVTMEGFQGGIHWLDKFKDSDLRIISAKNLKTSMEFNIGYKIQVGKVTSYLDG